MAFQASRSARAVFAQPNGELIVTANKSMQTLVWRVRPPDDVVQDSAVLPLSGRGVRTQIGDRIYFAVDSGLVGVKAKDLSPVGTVHLESRVSALAPTPSGDRLYIATVADSGISIVDRYTGRVGMGVVLPAPPADLRMDALGRYLLARFPKMDSAWVIAIGTNRLVGAVATRWDTDLPVITPDGRLATLVGKDVNFVDPETLDVKSTVAGGAKDFWYFFAWDGFRPRAQGLDQPVTFPGDTPAGLARGELHCADDSCVAACRAGHDRARRCSDAEADNRLHRVVCGAPHRGQSTAAREHHQGRRECCTRRANEHRGLADFPGCHGAVHDEGRGRESRRASKRDYWIYEGSP